MSDINIKSSNSNTVFPTVSKTTEGKLKNNQASDSENKPSFVNCSSETINISVSSSARQIGTETTTTPIEGDVNKIKTTRPKLTRKLQNNREERKLSIVRKKDISATTSENRQRKRPAKINTEPAEGQSSKNTIKKSKVSVRNYRESGTQTIQHKRLRPTKEVNELKTPLKNNLKKELKTSSRPKNNLKELKTPPKNNLKELKTPPKISLKDEEVDVEGKNYTFENSKEDIENTQPSESIPTPAEISENPTVILTTVERKVEGESETTAAEYLNCSRSDSSVTTFQNLATTNENTIRPPETNNKANNQAIVKNICTNPVRQDRPKENFIGPDFQIPKGVVKTQISKLKLSITPTNLSKRKFELKSSPSKHLEQSNRNSSSSFKKSKISRIPVPTQEFATYFNYYCKTLNPKIPCKSSSSYTVSPEESFLQQH